MAAREGYPEIVGWVRCHGCGKWAGLHAQSIQPDGSARGLCPWCQHENVFGPDEIEDAPTEQQ